MRKLVLSVLFLILTPTVCAQMLIETIELQNRPAEEVIETVRPFLVPGGSISATGYKLIIRSTRANIDEITKLLTDIDAAQQQLLVAVTMDRQTATTRNETSHRITVKGKNSSLETGPTEVEPDGAHAHIDNSRIKYDPRIFESRNTSTAPEVQQVRVTEGLWASIGAGQAIPIASRHRNPDGTVTETISYKQISSGFQVLARTQGENVSLRIRPQQQSVSQQGGGSFESTAMETTLTGKLGQWIAIGGIGEQTDASQSGINFRTRIRNSDYNQIWVKVTRTK